MQYNPQYPLHKLETRSYLSYLSLKYFPHVFCCSFQMICCWKYQVWQFSVHTSRFFLSDYLKLQQSQKHPKCVLILCQKANQNPTFCLASIQEEASANCSHDVKASEKPDQCVKPQGLSQCKMQHHFSDCLTEKAAKTFRGLICKSQHFCNFPVT